MVLAAHGGLHVMCSLFSIAFLKSPGPLFLYLSCTFGQGVLFAQCMFHALLILVCLYVDFADVEEFYRQCDPGEKSPLKVVCLEAGFNF